MDGDCKAKPDNEFAFVQFFEREPSGNLATLTVEPHTQTLETVEISMFAFDRSAAAVLMPLALLLAVVLWNRSDDSPAAPQQAQFENDADPVDDRGQTVAANFPSR